MQTSRPNAADSAASVEGIRLRAVQARITSDAVWSVLAHREATTVLVDTRLAHTTSTGSARRARLACVVHAGRTSAVSAHHTRDEIVRVAAI